ncbi:DNA polymerase IV [Thalassoglobus sp. JC818]|uniref:DNA polymerase IV n=1 Tax=Thalassoglobus sp. JC818 TaxID=3232136 RepID=UPI0034598AA7
MILHVDMDAFYASVEERENPTLKNRPLIVGGTRTGRGVVAAANYAAREFGIHSAMPARRAFQLCPSLISIRPRMEIYSAVSREIQQIMFRFTPEIEPLSLDEAFLDVSGCTHLFGPPIEIAHKLKEAILSETGLVASVGVAPNKFLAKIASDFDKPDGLVFVDSSRIQEFLDPLPVGRIWGVGQSTQSVLSQNGVHTIGDLRQLSRQQLTSIFGTYGDRFYQLARGIDERRVIPDRQAKSISHERTFVEDLSDFELIECWALELTDQVSRRLRRNKLRGKTVSLKIRFSDFRTVTRSHTVERATDCTQTIWEIAHDLLRQATKGQPRPVRLIGVGVGHLARPEKVQRTLFEDESTDVRSELLDDVRDRIQDRFGIQSLGRASGLLHNIKDRRSQPGGE